MKTEPIICKGDELEGVLAGIRDRGGTPESVDAMVNTNSGYRVNYFERVKEQPSGSTVAAGDQPENAGSLNPFPTGADKFNAGGPGRDARSDVGTHRTPETGSNPVPSTNPVPAVIAEDAKAHGGSVEPQTTHGSVKAWRWRADEGAPSSNLNAGNEPENPAGKSPKGSDQVTPEELRVSTPASGGGTQTESRVEDCHQHSHSISTPLPHCPTCSGPVTQGMACPICAGLERVKAGVRRLRNRFKTSTREARLPHPND